MASADQILKILRGLGSAENIAGMARFGIAVHSAYGVSMEPIRKLARGIGRDHALALELWGTGNREARILAALVASPKQLTKTQMNAWTRSFDSWEVCDNAAIHLFRKSPLAWERAWAWAHDRREFVRRAGFAMFATLAVHDKAAADEVFLETLPLIEEMAVDERNFVKKAVNWALRQIGKRNADLRVAAMATSGRLAESANAAARWVGKDALRELSASSNTRRSSRRPGTPSKRTAPGRQGRLKTPKHRPDPD
jgi:3-methyladenine DNA glycosylase AlkD